MLSVVSVCLPGPNVSPNSPRYTNCTTCDSRTMSWAPFLIALSSSGNRYDSVSRESSVHSMTSISSPLMKSINPMLCAPARRPVIVVEAVRCSAAGGVPRLDQLRPPGDVTLRADLHQLLKILRAPWRVAGERRRRGGAVHRAEPVRLLLQRRLEFLERLGRLLQLEQHLGQQLARRRERSRRHRVLLRAHPRARRRRAWSRAPRRVCLRPAPGTRPRPRAECPPVRPSRFPSPARGRRGSSPAPRSTRARRRARRCARRRAHARSRSSPRRTGTALDCGSSAAAAFQSRCSSAQRAGIAASAKTPADPGAAPTTAFTSKRDATSGSRSRIARARLVLAGLQIGVGHVIHRVQLFGDAAVAPARPQPTRCCVSIESCQAPTRVNVCDGMCSACGADGAIFA